MRAFVACSATWAAFLLVASPEARQAGYVIGAVCVLVVVGIHIRRLKPEVRKPAALIVAAGAASLIGVVARAVYGEMIGVPFPFPSPADVFTFLAYPLMLSAIVIVVRRRVGRLDLDLAIDAAVAGTSAAVVQITVIMTPFWESTEFSLAAKLTQSVYAMWSILIFMAATMTLVAGGHRSVSNRLLAAALVATFVVDNWGTYLSATGGDELRILSIAPFIYVFGGAGLLHPSLDLLTSRPPESTIRRSLTNKRIGVMTAALLAPPTLLVGLLFASTDHRLLLPAFGTLALAPLVLVRLGRLVRDRERLARQEASLRSVGERLVASETAEDVSRVIAVGAEQLLGSNALETAFMLDPLTTRSRQEGEVERLVHENVAAMRDVSSRSTGQLIELPLSDGRYGLAGLVMTQRHLQGVVIAITSKTVSEHEQLAFSSLCREAAIALRAVEQTEQNVRERSEKRFGALIDNSSDIVCILTDDGNLSYISPVASRLLGYQIGAQQTPTPLDLVHPDDRELAETVLDDIRFGERSPAELRLRHADGSYVWFEVVGVDLQSDPNIRGVVLNAREITRRKTAEQNLQMSEARFKALVQHSNDLVLVIGTTDGISYASPAVTSTIGVTPEDVLGKSLEEVFNDSGVDWEGALRIGRSATDHPNLLEFGFRNANGDWVHLEATVTDLRREEAVGGFVLNARDVTERATMMQRLRYQSTHDALTGLPNRVLATEELAGMLGRNAGSSTVAVISLDIDDFKDINDSLGHSVGDRLLYAVAERIKESLAFGDIAARTGGDEFIVALERAHGEAQVMEVAERFLASLERPFVVDGRELSVTASAGVACDHDRDTVAEVLLRNADTAMYRAKQLGKRRSVVFESHMHTASFDRLELRADLARAIETDQFLAHYQPIIDLDTHTIVGCEALIRWEHPRRGLLSPAIFVPLAEESGLIGAMGEWMLERACTDLAEWRRDMPEAADALTVSVNLTAQEVHGERLVPVVTDILRRTGLPADRLVLEVTESNLLSDTDVIQERMQSLRALGTRLAIDDFGTGYSSLGYVQRFAFDVLKIDRSFVEGLDRQTNQQIVTAVIDLARELGVRVVAEGIEEEAQEHALVKLGCRYAQGYRYSRPVPKSEFRKLLLQPLRSMTH